MKNERMKLEIVYAIEHLRGLMIASGDTNDVIHELEEQNRRLRSDKATLREFCYNYGDRIKVVELERNEVRQQRDRLAEALRELCETLLKDKPRDITELLNKAGEALTTMKGGSNE